MTKYGHLPIYQVAFDLNLYVEQIVRHFSRYHKYTLGTDLRNRSRTVMRLIVRANNAPKDDVEQRRSTLQELREEH